MAELADDETTIAVIEDDAVVLSAIVRALDPLSNVRPFDSFAEILRLRSSAVGVLVLVLGPSQSDEAGLEAVGQLVRADPGVGAVLVVDEPDRFVLRSALRAGLDDAVPLERVDEDLAAAIRDLEHRLRQATAELSPSSSPSKEATRGYVVAVYSPKGGAGRSVVAVNLAVTFAQRTRRRVVLIDTDPQFGDTSVMLRLNPTHTIIDAAAAGEGLDASLLESLLTHDERTGVDVLAAPTDPTASSKVPSKAITKLLELLRQMGALVVVDTPRTLDDVVLQVLSECDEIVYLVGMDVPSVKNARLGIQALELVQIPLTRALVVLNRADSKVQLAPRDVEKVLEMKVDVNLPSDPVVPKSVNRGVPVVVSDPRARFSTQILQIAEILLARAASEGAS